MGTKIEYVRGKVLEVTSGCTEYSVGCENCWARKEVWRMAHNPLLGNKWKGLVKKTSAGLRWTGKIKLFEDALEIPLKRKKPTTYFVDSKADLFHKDVPFEYIDKVFATASLCPQHKLLMLTKRTGRMLEYFTEDVGKGFNRDCFIEGQAHKMLCEKMGVSDYEYHAVHFPLSNIHLGVTICNQAEADEKIPILLQIPAAHRWISIEPMLEGVWLGNVRGEPNGNGKGWQGKKGGYPYLNCLTGREYSVLVGHDTDYKIDWVVVGCESGPKRRSCKLEHIRSIVQQCKAAGAGCYVKQIPINGKVEHDMSKFPEDLQARETI